MSGEPGDPWDDPEGEYDDMSGGAAPRIPKPDELLALHGATAEMFETLKRWFDVPDAVAIDLAEVDSAVTELGDPQMVIALAMRKLQALHLLATPGVATVTDVVVSIINDLERALVQAPNMWLKRRAAETNWDDELALLSAETGPEGIDPGRSEHPAVTFDDTDDVDRFRYLHAQLHEALFAVVEASEGEIRELE